MKRLTYPIRAIREPFGAAGLVVAIVALVAALGGGAYAASGGLNGKQKKEVAKIAKRFAGKPGARGATGPAGAKGATGAPGAPGQTGFTATLPSGATETGTWSVFASKVEGFMFPKTVGSISFPIPLAAKGAQGSAFVFNKADTANRVFGNSGCSGSVEVPTAPKGVLCIYTSEEDRENVVGKIVPSDPSGGVANFGRAGTLLNGLAFAKEPAEVHGIFSGTWAVTAP
jgi:hypothetical protein